MSGYKRSTKHRGTSAEYDGKRIVEDDIETAGAHPERYIFHCDLMH